MAKPNWLNTSPTQGSGNGVISNSALEHTGRVARTGIVTVVGVGVAEAKTYAVTQTPKNEFVQFADGNNASVSKGGGTVTITGTTNTSKLTFSWLSATDVSIPSSYTAAGSSATNGSAITGDPGATSQFDFNIQLDVSANEGITPITRTLKVVANGGQAAQIDIVQAAGDAYLTIEPIEITIPQDGSAVSVNVESNTTWTVS